MAKATNRGRNSAAASPDYQKAGWKRVYRSASSSIYTSPVPTKIIDGMIEANKQKRVLSTGTVIVSLSSKSNGKASDT